MSVIVLFNQPKKMIEYCLHKDEFMVSTDPAMLDLEVIYDFIIHYSYWGEGMTRERLQQQIKATSINFGLYYQQQQIGFTQVLTNFVTFAYLGNVFVLESYRGKGLSKWLMQAVKDHPELQTIRRWMLHTRDAHGLYNQFGFKEIKKPEEFMEREQ